MIVSAGTALVLALRVDNDPIDYFVYCAIWFFIAWGSGLIIVYAGDAILMIFEYKNRLADLRLSTAKKYKDIDNLNMPAILTNGPLPTVVYDRAAKWREWEISVFAWAGESIHYKGHLDAILTYDMWRKVFVKMLLDHVPPLIEPVQGGDRTELRGGLTVASVLFMLKSGTLSLPSPTDYDPPPPIAPNANAENAPKTQQTRQTVYNKDTQ